MGKQLGKRRHLLVTKEIEKRLEEGPKPHSDDAACTDAAVLVKFFSPYSGWTWYVTAGERRDDDWYLYGLVTGFEKEIGPFLLSELDQAEVEIFGTRVPAVERDMHFGDTHTLREFLG